MRILPPVIKPPLGPIIRRHKPRPATGQFGYRAYRPCLRWDFGFTCPYCLLHEVDFLRCGRAEGSGLTTAEHLILRSVAPERINDYDNCLYCCRYCNTARSTRPVEAYGCRLLDPTHDSWATYFSAENDCLLPRANDPNAQYTHESYDLDDPRKVAMRHFRRMLIENHLGFLQRGLALRARLLELAESRQDSPEVVFVLLRSARELRHAMLHAIDDLKGYPVVPFDAALRCRCETADHCCLPPYLQNQTRELQFRELATGD
jgi:hypothetical protein